jgi:hypothetical protein
MANDIATDIAVTIASLRRACRFAANSSIELAPGHLSVDRSYGKSIRLG